MQKRISIVALISLTISIVAFILYAILLNGTDVYILWIITSIAALFLPLLSKYIRGQNKTRGARLEVVALVIGSFDFYFIFFAATKWNIYIAYAVIALVCVLYAKLFNNDSAKDDTNCISEATSISDENTVKSEKDDTDYISEPTPNSEEHTVEPKKNDSDSDYKSESQVKVSLSDSTQPIQTTPNESRLTRGVDIALITEPVQDPSLEPVREPSPKSMPAPEPVQEPISQSAAHVSDPSKEITCTTAGSATPKRQKYCSRCGSLIKKTDTRCPGCNRRIMRLRINKFTVTIFVLLLIIAGLTGLNIIQYGYVQNQKKELQYIKKELENIREEKKAVTESFHYYLRYWEKNCDKVNFFDQHIVFVIDSYSNYYFTYDQMMLVTKGLESYSCWAYNTEQAIAKGYKAWK